MNSLEKKLSESFHKAIKEEKNDEVSKYFLKLRAYVIENEHNTGNFKEVVNTYIHYLNAYVPGTTKLEDKNKEPEKLGPRGTWNW